MRPDGTELEVFAIGLRNPFAIAIDPFMNLFTRDNTNDGAGWDVRVSHLIQTADYGYHAEVRELPRRDHAAPRRLRPGRRDRRAVAAR